MKNPLTPLRPDQQKTMRLRQGEVADRVDKYANDRVAVAHGQTYEDANKGWGDWMWDKTRGGVNAAQDWLGQEVGMGDVGDLLQSIPSAATRLAENTAGLPGDTNELMWTLAQAMNQGQRKFTGSDQSLNTARARKFAEESPLARFSPLGQLASTPTTDTIHEFNKGWMPEFATHEPTGPLGGALHTAMDFVDPEVFAAKGIRAARGFLK